MRKEPRVAFDAGPVPHSRDAAILERRQIRKAIRATAKIPESAQILAHLIVRHSELKELRSSKRRLGIRAASDEIEAGGTT